MGVTIYQPDHEAVSCLTLWSPWRQQSRRVDDGRAVMALMLRESKYNPIGSVHGGIIATVLDSVMNWSASADIS